MELTMGMGMKKGGMIMKRTIRNLALAAVLGSAIFTGCEKDGMESRVGEAVRFSVTSSGAPTTKTSYGDDVDGFQLINWRANDTIQIWSDNATHRYGNDQHWADYYVTGATTEGHKSKATLSAEQLFNTDNDSPVQSANGLVWGEEGETKECQFWGIYPSKKNNPAITLEDSVVTATLPASYALATSSTKTDNSISYKVCAPDMNYAFMTAAQKVTGTPSAVDLEFNAAFTAIEIYLSSADDDIAVTSVGLQSASTNLSGKYTMTAGNLNTVQTLDGGEASKAVTYTASSSVAVTKGSGLNVTFFTIPKTNAGVISLIVNTDQGRAKLKFLQKGTSTAYPFEAGHKYRIHLLKMGGKWQILFGDDKLTVEPWDEQSTELIVE